MQQSGTLPGASQDVAAPHGAGGAAVLGQAQRSRNVAALVEFSGLRDWQEIRFRLTRITGLKGLEVDLLSARGAAVTFDYAGSLDTLQAVLGLNGFVLDERNGTFVLRSR